MVLFAIATLKQKNFFEPAAILTIQQFLTTIDV